jgi:acyl-coenzyme A synthetase/AMP-(fatty) acid ligase
VKKGDRITIYMPMVPEAAIAMLACARVGAVHSVVFGGFSPESLAGRIHDCASTLVITADEGVRGGKKVPLKANVDEAIASHKLAVRTSSSCAAPALTSTGSRDATCTSRKSSRPNLRAARLSG